MDADDADGTVADAAKSYAAYDAGAEGAANTADALGIGDDAGAEKNKKKKC